MTFDGSRIVILGGSSGIGLAVAQAAAKAGAETVIASSNRTRIDTALASLPRTASGHALDLRDEAAMQAFFGEIGPFDHLVYTAGEALQLGALAETDLAQARGFFELRYWGAYAAAKHGAAQIRPGGSITFTSGTAGARPQAGWSLGASLCSAMEGLTRALAIELAPLRVNAVAPGFVRSPLWDPMPEAQREALYAQVAGQLPLRHIGSVEEIATSYLYLIAQSYGTGQVLTVDGGGSLV